ncbi:MAG: hypothetical protein K8J31_07795 [Anaerolineae bacterium]|nr:hypothetical protein [Anaerolineae bacterium]
MSVKPTEVHPAPWILQRHFDGDIDLDGELNSRFHAMAVLSALKARRLDASFGTAMLTTQDGAAALRVDVLRGGDQMDFVFTARSMLALKFSLVDIGTGQRARWLELIRSPNSSPAFLWGPTRWNSDYLIAVAHQYYTNLYAFSSNNFEAAARVTPDVMGELLDWLESLWISRPPSDETIPSKRGW